MEVKLRKDKSMGNFGKKLLGMGALGAAAGAAAYYFMKKKNETRIYRKSLLIFRTT